RQKPLLGLSR
nr:Chain B, Alkaline phosphatase peptide [Escherichia coli K-12]